MDFLILFIRIILGFLFLSAGWSKIKEVNQHIGIVKEYKILPDKYIKKLVLLEITLEIVVGAFLLLGLFHQYIAVIAILLLCMYSIAISINLFRGRTNISCGCGGMAGNHQLSWKLVLRNLCLIITCFMVYKIDCSLGSLSSFMFSKTPLYTIYSFESIFTIIFSFALITVYALFQQVIKLKQIVTNLSGK